MKTTSEDEDHALKFVRPGSQSETCNGYSYDIWWWVLIVTYNHNEEEDVQAEFMLPLGPSRSFKYPFAQEYHTPYKKKYFDNTTIKFDLITTMIKVTSHVP